MPDSPSSSQSAPPVIRIFVADDHGAIRDGVKMLIARTGGLQLVGEAADGRALIQGVLGCHPDVLVADISMPELNGIDAIRQLRARGFEGAIVLLTSHDERRYVAEALAAGASAYVHKEDAFDRLVEAIESAYRGRQWLSPRLAGTGDGTAGQTLDSLLSAREREVLQLLAEGNNTKEVAYKLALSTKTVEFHRLNILAKLKANGLADLVRIAVKEGLVRL